MTDTNDRMILLLSRLSAKYFDFMESETEEREIAVSVETRELESEVMNLMMELDSSDPLRFLATNVCEIMHDITE